MPVRKDRVMRDLTEYACQYARKGLSVIPMIRKKPMIKFADKPPLTEEEIRKFWKTHPYANIAVKTDKFFVLSKIFALWNLFSHLLTDMSLTLMVYAIAEQSEITFQRIVRENFSQPMGQFYCRAHGSCFAA